ncbi:hypothetical protein VitviT2T_023350 [Vitis vinifera]|uniref:Uncharacterized protein n=1 Tax=Vitis vinifera TaxID=29760 RepID=A0ABY9DCH6_VITVI|nr:hypothetical protein VitviT2T_023350 [Vitis vinifera]
MTRSTDKTEKPQKFSATLSQEEINEDFRAMTGCRPPTRPKKGPKNVQRIVDRLIPGSRLNRVTRELYNVKGALDPCMVRKSSSICSCESDVEKFGGFSFFSVLLVIGFSGDSCFFSDIFVSDL